MDETAIDDAMEAALVEAADWLVRLTSGEATDEDAVELAEWRARDPINETAFSAMAGLGRATRAIALEPTPRIDRRAFITGGSLALAAVATVGVARPPFGLWPSWAELTASRRVGLGGEITFAPSTGVVVALGSRGSASDEQNGRALRLVHGEMLASVRQQRAPFTVETDVGQFSTTDGALNVVSLAEGCRVTCVAGRVDAALAVGRRTLSRGDEIAIGRNAELSIRHGDPLHAIAWRRGLLYFSDTPLAEAVARINLYRPGRLILLGNTAGPKSISGLFHVDQIGGAAAQLRALLGVSLSELPGGITILGAS